MEALNVNSLNQLKILLERKCCVPSDNNLGTDHDLNTTHAGVGRDNALLCSAIQFVRGKRKQGFSLLCSVRLTRGSLFLRRELLFVKRVLCQFPLHEDTPRSLNRKLVYAMKQRLSTPTGLFCSNTSLSCCYRDLQRYGRDSRYTQVQNTTSKWRF